MKRIFFLFCLVQRGNGFDVDPEKTFAVFRQGVIGCINNTQRIFFFPLHEEQRRSYNEPAFFLTIIVLDPGLNKKGVFIIIVAHTQSDLFLFCRINNACCPKSHARFSMRSAKYDCQSQQ